MRDETREDGQGGRIETFGLRCPNVPRIAGFSASQRKQADTRFRQGQRLRTVRTSLVVPLAPMRRPLRGQNSLDRPHALRVPSCPACNRGLRGHSRRLSCKRTARSPADEGRALAISLWDQPDGGDLSHPLLLVKRQRGELVNKRMSIARHREMLVALWDRWLPWAQANRSQRPSPIEVAEAISGNIHPRIARETTFGWPIGDAGKKAPPVTGSARPTAREVFFFPYTHKASYARGFCWEKAPPKVAERVFEIPLPGNAKTNDRPWAKFRTAARSVGLPGNPQHPVW